MAQQGCLKKEAPPLAHTLCWASTSQTADGVSLPTASGAHHSGLRIPGRDGVFWSIRLPLPRLRQLWSPQGERVQQVENDGHVWCCVPRLGSLQAQWTPGEDSRHWLDPESQGRGNVFHSTQLSGLPLTQDLNEIHYMGSRILEQTYGWAWGQR